MNATGQLLVLGPFLSQMPRDHQVLPSKFEDILPSNQ
jgi:hypothetical protein